MSTYQCPTPCDDDCEVLCHETHVPRFKREHDADECVARAILASDWLATHDARVHVEALRANPSEGQNAAWEDGYGQGRADERHRVVMEFVQWVASNRAFNGSPYPRGQSLYNECLNGVLDHWAADFLLDEARLLIGGEDE